MRTFRRCNVTDVQDQLQALQQVQEGRRTVKSVENIFRPP
jgi:hypothetical protein